jgi:hypothetical protein
MPRTKRISSRARLLLKVDGIQSPSSSTILRNKHSSALKV